MSRANNCKGNCPQEVRLCSGRQETAFVEAWLVHCVHKILNTDETTIKATDRQIRVIMQARAGIAIVDANYYRLKRKFISRPGKPATKFELLKEVVKGRRQEGELSGTPSEYELTGLGWLFDQPGAFDNLLPAEAMDRRVDWSPPPGGPAEIEDYLCLNHWHWEDPEVLMDGVLEEAAAYLNRGDCQQRSPNP